MFRMIMGHCFGRYYVQYNVLYHWSYDKLYDYNYM